MLFLFSSPNDQRSMSTASEVFYHPAPRPHRRLTDHGDQEYQAIAGCLSNLNLDPSILQGRSTVIKSIAATIRHAMIDVTHTMRLEMMVCGHKMNAALKTAPVIGLCTR